MIDAARLMLWNKIFVVIPNDVKLSEVAVCPNDLVDINQGRLTAFPIPITTKLLIERCGFRGNGFMTEAVGVSHFDSDTAVHIIPNPLQKGSWLLCYKDVKIAIDAVHELQQAWFVLFRKELEIK